MKKKMRVSAPNSQHPHTFDQNVIIPSQIALGKVSLTVLLSVILLGYLHIYHYTFITVLLVGIGLLIIVAISVALALGTWYLSEYVLILRADRVNRQKEAETMVMYDDRGQVFLRDTNPLATVRALHLQQVYESTERPTPDDTRQWETFTLRNQAKPINSTQLSLEDNNMISLPVLTHLETSARVIIKGISGGGKTNLLKHVADHKLNDGDVYVIDPHASPNKWGGAMVIGGGANYEEIDSYLDAFITEMTTRFQAIYTGETEEEGFRPLTIIIDEFMSIAYQCKGAKAVIVRLITESRKAGYNLFIGTHSDRVSSLGLDGQGDLRDGLTIVRLYHEQGVRTSTVDYGKGEIDAPIAPLFTGWANSSPSLDTVPLSLPEPQEETLTSDEALCCELKDQGFSLNKIASKVFNSTGGNQNKLIKAAIAKREQIARLQDGK